MRVLITGGTGFLGRNLRRDLAQAGVEVHYTTRGGTSARAQDPLGSEPGHAHTLSLAQTSPIESLLRELKPDGIIHLAALAKPNRSLEDFDLQYEHTIRPAINLARAIPIETPITLFVGSIEEYGGNPPPFVEDQLPHVISPYGWGKSASLHAVDYIARLRQLRMAWIRPSLVYGPSQSHQALVPSLIRSCLRGERVDLTPGEQTRDLLYVRDLSARFLTVLKKPEPALGQILNFCSGREVQVRELARTIQTLCGGGDLRIGAIPYRTHEAMRFYSSTAKFEQLYGKLPLTTLEKGLTETIEAYRQSG